MLRWQSGPTGMWSRGVAGSFLIGRAVIRAFVTKWRGVRLNGAQAGSIGETPVSAACLFHARGDVDPAALNGATVAVLGYGNLGRSMALNLRDSGLKVVVGNRDDTYWQVAADDGMDVTDINKAVAGADITYVLLPDEVIPEFFASAIGPYLRPRSAVCFASGYVLAFNLITPAADVDVLMLAPRMLGEEVRTNFLNGSGFFSYVSVEQDASGIAETRLLALALACGTLARGAMRLSATQEAYLDLLVEQTVGPYLAAAFQLAFDTGLKQGLPPEALVLELYMSGEMSRTIQTFADVGMYRSASWHGLTALYGGFLGSLAVDRRAMRRMFAERANQIAAGKFSAQFQAEKDAGYPTKAAIDVLIRGDDPLSQAEARVRRALKERHTRTEIGGFMERSSPPFAPDVGADEICNLSYPIPPFGEVPSDRAGTK
jgi:ketol-acid reductoisomerase